MTEIIGHEYNCETGEVIELYADEAYYAKLAQTEEEIRIMEEETAARSAQRAGILARLGLTEEEIKLILGVY